MDPYWMVGALLFLDSNQSNPTKASIKEFPLYYEWGATW